MDEYGNVQEKRYPEVEDFDQLCANLKARLVAQHEGDCQTTQHLYRGIVVMAYGKAKERLLARKPPDCEEPTNIERGEWRTPEWKRFRFNHGEISRLMRKWRSISFKEIRQNSLNSKLKLPRKNLTEIPQTLVE
jgi:hypothetical protein